MEVEPRNSVKQRTHYLPIEGVVEGMVLAEAVKNKWMQVLLPRGAVLSSENIQQLLAHQVEFVCVSHTETRSSEEVAVDAATSARKILDVFSGADLSNPTMAALFNQVLLYRSA
jgi:hypothetical protein